ncbi:uncharacterized protein LACBIDRAFT_322405 [Laccaria bicolor S238N-H82]|uniref:Predicted protein n=1 Tax=Laccaria bicolor (strain S238N-H82 / ATCC MYA-4686) TaxID=486041 RepID=B0CW62_LACBS|nr:uncharacterized protein LACBIDRAFT_322405 [Laccaria bicolor S238N-H82]EDR13011.1 predicted protein [Laccaria bicolor S238N-H82]|eukprot:XP_001875509.1 predicted protein [Laccaria bicolor S238N-H82]
MSSLTEYQKALKRFEVASDYDTSNIIAARAKVTQLEVELWNIGQWATILIDTGFMFLQAQLKRSDNLITIPMFEKLKLIDFNKSTEWWLTVLCWLSIFMDFAKDSYKYLAFPPAAWNIKSILDIKEHSSPDIQFLYGFLGPEFHTIIDNAYKTHLATPFFAFANPSKTIIDAYILDEAHKEYPYISKLRSPLPLACETFIKDIGTSLHENENAILEFLTLFELTIAIFNLDKVAGLTNDYIEEISSCIDILLHSYSSWASQSQSSTNQHNFGIAVGAIQLNRELDNVYKSFLENEQDYLSSTVNLQLKDLLHSLAKECVHQAFFYEQNEEYAPFEPLDGCDGVLKTYDNLKDKSMKKEAKRAEARAQAVVNKKASKRDVDKRAKKCFAAGSTSSNTPAEDAAIRLHDNDALDPIPPPSNQLANAHNENDGVDEEDDDDDDNDEEEEEGPALPIPVKTISAKSLSLEPSPSGTPAYCLLWNISLEFYYWWIVLISTCAGIDHISEKLPLMQNLAYM